jgi:hypothetical protein
MNMEQFHFDESDPTFLVRVQDIPAFEQCKRAIRAAAFREAAKMALVMYPEWKAPPGLLDAMADRLETKAREIEQEGEK